MRATSNSRVNNKAAKKKEDLGSEQNTHAEKSGVVMAMRASPEPRARCGSFIIVVKHANSSRSVILTTKFGFVSLAGTLSRGIHAFTTPRYSIAYEKQQKEHHHAKRRMS